jgi:hypothetical protein
MGSDTMSTMPMTKASIKTALPWVEFIGFIRFLVMSSPVLVFKRILA